MAFRKPRFNPQSSRRRAQLPPLIHPSWRIEAALPEAGGSAQIMQARDFWDRLGI